MLQNKLQRRQALEEGSLPSLHHRRSDRQERGANV